MFATHHDRNSSPLDLCIVMIRTPARTVRAVRGPSGLMGPSVDSGSSRKSEALARSSKSIASSNGIEVFEIDLERHRQAGVSIPPHCKDRRPGLPRKRSCQGNTIGVQGGQRVYSQPRLLRGSVQGNTVPVSPSDRAPAEGII